MIIFEKLKKENKILFMLVVISLICIITNYNGKIDNYNTTILALNYSYGFTSRGFIGSIFLFLDKLTPFSIMNTWGALRFYQLSTFVFLVIIFIFARMIIKRAQDTELNLVTYILAAIVIMMSTTFAGEYNFGRIDMYMIAIALICTELIMVERFEWLIIPLSAIGVMIHQGYAMMYFNIVLVLLFYKFFTVADRKAKLKYAVIFILSILIAGILFLYLELFSHASNGKEIFDDVAAIAAGLAVDGTYHKTLLQHEILGVDLSEVEHGFHMKNLVEIIVLILFLLPYIVIAIKLFINIWKTAAVTICDKLKYLAVFLGSLTMAPDYLIKVDYGRWVTSTLMYYLVVLLVLILIDDKVREVVIKLVSQIKQANVLCKFLLVYPVLFVPFLDVNIDQITAMIGHVLNRELLGWW